MSSRWERILDSKPIPVIEHLKDEVAKLLTKDLATWPPQMMDVDPDYAARNVSTLGPDAKKPEPKVFLEAVRLTKWDLDREFDAYDDYIRNERFIERGLAATDKPVLLLLQRWLTEQLLALGEATEGRIKRKDMLDVLDRLSRNLGLTLLIH